MATTLEVVCIRRGAPGGTVEALCGEADGRAWSKTEAEVMRDLDSGRSNYVVRVGLRTARLRIDRSGGHHRLVTAVDDTPQLLLALPDCN